jgi:carbamoyltransferase
MNVLGLSFDFHDSSAALVVDGKVIAAAAEERFSRQKHDNNFPALAIEFCLAKAGIALSDVDLVIFYEKPAQKWTRVLTSTLATWPFSRKEFTQSMKNWFGKKLWTKVLLSRRLGLRPEQIRELAHHESHAAQTFLVSGFHDAAIVVVDAVGEWSTCSIGRATWSAGKPKIELTDSSEYPHSLGLVYSAFTEFLGFRAMNDECSTMALAAFGKPRFRGEVEKVIAMDNDGKLRLDTSYLQFDRFFSSPFTKKFIQTFGEPFRGAFRFSSLGTPAIDDVQARIEQHYADVAASVQFVFEEHLLRLAKVASRQAGSRNICYAGGGALNCVANGRLIREGGYSIFVPTEPGDGGAALGAALLGYFQEQGGGPKLAALPYHGEAHTFDESLLSHIEVPQLKRFRKKDLDVEYRKSWTWQRFSEEDSFLQHAAHLLRDGKSVGWIQGGFEFGPRALGHRSILFRPDNVQLARHVSRNVKSRASFRPYALAMTESASHSLLDWQDLTNEGLKWMQLAVPVKEHARGSVRAGLHVDFTTRPQVVAHDTRFQRLLETYGQMAQAPECLINTSFNESDYPIVNHPLEGLVMFARTDLDALIIDRLIIEKRSQ